MRTVDSITFGRLGMLVSIGHVLLSVLVCNSLVCQHFSRKRGPAELA
jgi:hypothetical protein